MDREERGVLTKAEREEYRKEIEAVIAGGPFSADWESLSQYETPAWFSRLRKPKAYFSTV